VVEWLAYKGEEGRREIVAVEAAYTSQTCPQCGLEKAWPGDLGQRQRRCEACGYEGQRDVAAAQVILQRALNGRKPAAVEGAVGDPTKQEPACDNGMILAHASSGKLPELGQGRTRERPNPKRFFRARVEFDRESIRK